MFLQSILKNRFLFILCMAVLWALILVIPMIGRHYRYNNEQSISTSTKKDILDGVLINNQEVQKKDILQYLHAGEFSQNNLCIDTVDGKINSKIGLWECHGAGRNQFWFIMKDNLAMKNADLCINGPPDLKNKDHVYLQECNGKENQAWGYDDKGSLKLSGSTLCLQANLKQKDLYLAECDENIITQKWTKKTPPGM